jgi:hypothetical protein
LKISLTATRFAADTGCAARRDANDRLSDLEMLDSCNLTSFAHDMGVATCAG